MLRPAKSANQLTAEYLHKGWGPPADIQLGQPLCGQQQPKLAGRLQGLTGSFHLQLGCGAWLMCRFGPALSNSREPLGGTTVGAWHC